MNILIKIIVVILFLAVTALLSEFDAALDEAEQRKFEGSDKKCKKLQKLFDLQDATIPQYKFGALLFGAITAVLTAALIYGGLKSSAALSNVQLYLFSAIIFAVCIIIEIAVGFLAPKKIASAKADNILNKYVGLLYPLHSLFAVFTKIAEVISNLCVRLTGIDPENLPEDITEQEIRQLVDAGEETGVIEESQRDMINNIFEFDDITVGDVMHHRTEIAAVDIEDGLNEAIRLAIDGGYSRLPVFDGRLDNIIGIVYVKDLLKYVGRRIPAALTLKSVMREAFHVPQTKRCGELFTEMTEKHLQMAVVIDEYGGTAGLVTLEDLVESIVGNIQDEYDNEQEEIKKVNETTYTIEGVCEIDEVEQMLDVSLPKGDYDTLGGMILSMLGKIPNENEHPFVEAAGYRFTVEKTDERRIETVKAEKLNTTEQ